MEFVIKYQFYQALDVRVYSIVTFTGLMEFVIKYQFYQALDVRVKRYSTANSGNCTGV